MKSAVLSWTFGILLLSSIVLSSSPEDVLTHDDSFAEAYDDSADVDLNSADAPRGSADPDINDVVPSNKLRILVFGGNGLLGADAVEKLLQLPNGADIYLVHRGNWYWDTEITIKPFVSDIFICDRNERLKDCGPLSEFISKSGTYFDYVIDFSALDPSLIEESLYLLKRTFVGLYIYISSDSIYEVTKKEDSSVFSVEEDDQRPADQREAKRLNALDSYGHGKLECEESLARHRSVGGPPYVSLRLPDVIGPRDNTNRFWMTHILFNLHTFLTKPLRIPNDNFKMSFVYSSDVASLLYSIVTSSDPLSFADSAFNVAWPQPITFHEFYSAVGASVPIGKPFHLEKVEKDEDNQAALKPHFYPSVTRGPMNVSKVQRVFDWEPTEFRRAIAKILDFYKEASSKYPDNFKRALRGLSGKLDEETLKKASYGVYAVELSSGGCIDLHPKCGLWAVTGECDKNPRWMKTNCMESCKTCHLLDKAREKKQTKDEL